MAERKTDRQDQQQERQPNTDLVSFLSIALVICSRVFRVLSTPMRKWNVKNIFAFCIKQWNELILIRSRTNNNRSCNWSVHVFMFLFRSICEFDAFVLCPRRTVRNGSFANEMDICHNVSEHFSAKVLMKPIINWWLMPSNVSSAKCNSNTL